MTDKVMCMIEENRSIACQKNFENTKICKKIKARHQNELGIIIMDNHIA